MTLERILDDIHDNVGKKFNRVHLVTRKDIANIERMYGIKRHPVDSISVSTLVEEMKSRGEDNPILLYKQQGSPQPDSCEYLKNEDFVIALQTPLQREMLKQFASNRVVCIDATHGTNAYDFELITVLVVDEYGEGFPVAWCISNRQDHLLLANFFTHLKANVGEITPAWLMTDDAEQFYTSWISVFGVGPRKLLCSWHAERAWRTKLSLICDRESQAIVYHNLRLLMEETSIETFETLLEKTVIHLNSSNSTQQFAQYFIQNYIHRKEQ